jgi:hypothetical protein
VFKYGNKTRRRVKQGHRQDLTVLRVSDIAWGGRSAAKDAEANQASERRAADEAAAEAARRAAADQALAAQLAREADNEAPTEGAPAPDAVVVEATGDAGETTAQAATPSADAPARPQRPGATTKVTGSAAPRTPASRTQAPAPDKDAPKRRTTKKDE